MKCYSTFLIFLLFTTLAFAQEVVTPLDHEVIHNGEIYWVVVESSATDEELKSYKDQFVNDVMYVLDFKKLGDKRLFEVFVADPPERKPEEEAVEPRFPVSGFKYEYLKKNSEGKLEYYSTEYELDEDSKRTYTYSILGLLLFLLAIADLLLRKRILNRFRLKKLKKKKSKELLRLIQDAKTRDEFEKLVNDKRYIEDLFIPSEPLEKFIAEIDKVQYKETWTDEEMDGILKRQMQIYEVRTKNGI